MIGKETNLKWVAGEPCDYATTAIYPDKEIGAAYVYRLGRNKDSQRIVSQRVAIIAISTR